MQGWPAQGPPACAQPIWLWSGAVAGGEGAPHSASFHLGRSGLGAGKQNKEGFSAGMRPPPQPPQGPGWRGVMLTPPRGRGGSLGIAQKHFAPSAAAVDQPQGISWHKEAETTMLFICSEERCARFIQDPNGPHGAWSMSYFYLPYYLFPMGDDTVRIFTHILQVKAWSCYRGPLFLALSTHYSEKLAGTAAATTMACW